MKKKIFSTLLMGAFFLASMSMFTSCKDYDDDINRNSDAISALQQQIAQLQADLKTATDNLTTAQGNLNTILADYATKAYADAAATAAAEAARVEAIKNALEQANALVKAGDPSTEDLQALAAKVAALGSLNTLGLDVLGNAETGALAAQENVKTQLDAILYLKDLISTKNPDFLDDLDNLEKTVKAMTDGLGTTDLDELKSIMQKVSNAVSGTNTNLDVIEVYMTKYLTSIMLDPAFYWGGIEAVEAIRVAYTPLKYTTKLDIETANTKNAIDSSKPYNIFTVEYNDKAAGELDATNQLVYTYPEVVAEYHMNPSTVKESSISSVSVISADKEAYSRAAAADPQVKSWSVKDGILTAQIGVTYKNIEGYEYENGTSLPSNYDPSAQPNKVTMFAAQAHYTNSEGNDTTVTSDWAAIAKSVVEKFVIADINPDAPVVNNSDTYSTGALTTDPNPSPVPCTVDNKAVHVYRSAHAAIANPATHDIAWDAAAFDLSTIIRVHANYQLKVQGATSKEQDFTDKLDKLGMSLSYQLVSYSDGENNTEQTTTHARLNGSNFQPMGINGAQDRSSIDRKPLVRIELRDNLNGGQLVQVGYVKFNITETKAADVEIPAYEGNAYLLCGGFHQNLLWNQVEADILANQQIREKGMSKTVFERVYSLNENVETPAKTPLQTLTAGDAKGKARTYVKQDGKWTALAVGHVLAEVISYKKEVVDAEGNMTNVLGIDLTKDQLNYILAKKNTGSDADNNPYLDANGNPTNDLNNAALNETGSMQLAARFYDIDNSGYPDIYVTWNVTVRKMQVSLNKIAEYWYATNSNEKKSGYAEIHVNVDPVGQKEANLTWNGANVTIPAASIAPFDGDFLATLVQNEYFIGKGIKADGIDQIALDQLSKDNENDQTPAGAAKKNYALKGDLNFIIDGAQKATVNGTAMTGKVVTGISGQQYFVYVDPQTGSKTLYAALWDGSKVDSSKPAEPVVTIEDEQFTHNLNSVFTMYNDGDVDNMSFAEDILNYAPHTDLANTLTAKVRLTLTENVTTPAACESPIDLTDDTFNVKFLRPVNIAGAEGKEFTDAIDHGNELNLLDLVEFTDWRDLWAPAYGITDANLFTGNTNRYADETTNYFLYYQVKSITPDIANITTDLNGNDINTTKLSEVTQLAQFAKGEHPTVLTDWRYYGVDKNASDAAKQAKDLGTLIYNNNNLNVAEFNVRVPLKVAYYWGEATTYVTIKVKNTLANVTPAKKN